MTELAKQVVSAMFAGTLESDPLVETALDRVMAFAVGGMREPLGEALCRLKYLQETTAYQEALDLLTRRTRHRAESWHQTRRVCERVLEEWMDDLCQTCEGRGHMVAEGAPHARQACATCETTGKRPVSEQGRCAYLGVSPDTYDKWRPRFERAYRALDKSDAALWDEAATQLGRSGAGRRAVKNFLALRGKERILRGSRHPANNNTSRPEKNDDALPGAQL